ncbi:MAG: hypothetical protein A2902_02760 [Elusimicrobia bacterium RIFCSPLOWO2_01_FULL_64_13]|nr:MAG: hypothetical protein A2902_02760 [Elusimicrobia bacterium RIFCSPLOWO2_01_FULL_64_13]
MNEFFYKARKKEKKMERGVAGVLLLLAAALLLVSVALPSLAGRFGQVVHHVLFRFAGAASFLLPLALGWAGLSRFFKERPNLTRDAALFGLDTVFLASLLSVFHTAKERAPGGAGGWLGDQVSLFLIQQFGGIIVFAVSLGAVYAASSLLLGFSPLALAVYLKDKIADDIEAWKEERKKIREQEALRKKIEKSAFKPSGAAAAPETKPASSPAPFGTLDSVLNSRLKSLDAKAAAPAAPKPKSHPPSPRPAASPQAADAPGPNPYEGYHIPDPDLLTISGSAAPEVTKDELYANGTLLEETLEQFGVKAKVVDIHPGPVITRYDLSPAPGVRVQQIDTLADDIALAMKAQSLRVLAPVPGKAAVGIEISNSHPATVTLKEIIASAPFQKESKGLPIGLGRMTEGEVYVGDLSAMPHLLIAGATGSGKSVCIHALILSLLFRFRPDEVKLLLVDPKRLELPIYDGIPHLYDPAATPENVRAITQPKDAVVSLKKLIDEMEERYRNFAKAGVRNIEGYNERAAREKIPSVPYLVVIIDELADLMVVVGREIEELIQRLAQMARAVGIHLVLATQRPSVDVITGVIKADLPSRIAFQVLSKTDSRVILDAQGAEDLLGKGDMLFLATGAPKPVRLQGAFVAEADVARVVQFIKEQDFKPLFESRSNGGQEGSIVDSEENRQLLVRAARVVRDTEKVSGDLLRADKEIGSRYDLALTLLKKRGLIEKPRDTNRWKIHFEQLEQYLAEVEKEEA